MCWIQHGNKRQFLANVTCCQAFIVRACHDIQWIMHCTSAACTAVTCACHVSDDEVSRANPAATVHAGVGSQLLVYGLPGGELRHNLTVLPAGARLHGVHSVPCSSGFAVAVHGDHYARVGPQATINKKPHESCCSQSGVMQSASIALGKDILQLCGC